MLGRLVQHFSKLKLRNDGLSEPDMLGRAYGYLIERFADDAGKKGGEFYTPHKVVELIVKLLEPKQGMRICDPTCGSGGMLIQLRIEKGDTIRDTHGRDGVSWSELGQDLRSVVDGRLDTTFNPKPCRTRGTARVPLYLRHEKSDSLQGSASLRPRVSPHEHRTRR